MTASRFKMPGKPADEFIEEAPGAGASPTPGPTQAGQVMPWEEPHVRDDLRQDLNLTVPERTKKKLDWLAHNTKRSKRVIVETALDIYLSAELRRLGMK